MASDNKQGNAAWQSSAHIEPADAGAAPGTQDERMQGLPARAQRLATRAQRWMERREFAFAERTLQEALALAVENPELLRLRAVALHAQERYADAIALLRRAAALSPDDALIHNNLGSALGESGDYEGAIDAFRRASEVAPGLVASWFNLGKACDSLLRTHEAEQAFARALEIDATHLPALVLHANALKMQGRLDDAEIELRRALSLQPHSAEAWAALVGMKSTPPTAEDLATLETLYRDPSLSEGARTQIGFAYTLALEAHERYADAFEAAVATNAMRRKQVRWDAASCSRIIDGIQGSFEMLEPHPPSDFGREVIFLVGMPRSGSTLAEQILATHPEVHGAGELGQLAILIREESRNRGVDFPLWVDAATPGDWARLGQTYLERTAIWRRSKPRFTDKSLHNWQLVGAARMMLPGAKVVDCRRDPVESCWSSFKHQFADEIAFTYDLEELAAYWCDYERLMRFWKMRYPGLVWEHDYEAMLADPEPRIRALLAHCGLEFDPACLRFHELQRDVRTASAGQVRSPLRRDTARAHHYGALLDPLRRACAV